MKKRTWTAARQASKYLGVSEDTLSNWRVAGYLKLGKHWKNSRINTLVPWSTKVVYQLELCEKEINELWGRELSSKAEYLHRSRRDRHMDQVVLGPFKKVA